MDNIIIRNGKAVEPKLGATAMPLGVEYEELQRRVQKDDKVERQDYRNEKKTCLDRIDNGSEDNKNSGTTILLAPGMMIPYENTSSDWKPYPQSDLPSQNSERWINR
jgi:hypothetical protein